MVVLLEGVEVKLCITCICADGNYVMLLLLLFTDWTVTVNKSNCYTCAAHVNSHFEQKHL